MQSEGKEPLDVSSFTLENQHILFTSANSNSSMDYQLQSWTLSKRMLKLTCTPKKCTRIYKLKAFICKKKIISVKRQMTNWNNISNYKHKNENCYTEVSTRDIEQEIQKRKIQMPKAPLKRQFISKCNLNKIHLLSTRLTTMITHRTARLRGNRHTTGKLYWKQSGNVCILTADSHCIRQKC